MPIGIDAIVEPVIDITSYVWGQKDGRFRRFQANAFQGAAGANGTNGASGYSITDNTAASSDLLLAAGDIAYIDYTSATSVPLDIQTEEGLYEIDIIGDASVTTPSDVDCFLLPNVSGSTQPSSNITYTDTYLISTSTPASGTGANASRFTIGNQLSLISHNIINTKTTGKSLMSSCISHRKSASSTQIISRQWNGWWMDTTNAWTSLGTVDFTNAAQTGKIVIRRII